MIWPIAALLAPVLSIAIAELNSMKVDHLIKLQSLADAPVDIFLEGKVVARGQLVAVEDNFRCSHCFAPLAVNPERCPETSINLIPNPEAFPICAQPKR